jgi:hypothetical protein
LVLRGGFTGHRLKICAYGGFAQDKKGAKNAADHFEGGLSLQSQLLVLLRLP